MVECVCGMQDNAIYFTNNQICLEYKYAFYALSTCINRMTLIIVKEYIIYNVHVKREELAQ